MINSHSTGGTGTNLVLNPHIPVKIETLADSSRPVEYFLAETIDGLYVPYALRTPADTGKFPFVFLGYGNGGMGFKWLQDRVRNFGYIMEKFLQAGYACAWGRYRSEVELGYNTGGRLIIDRRQGMDLLNRAPRRSRWACRSQPCWRDAL
jgi:hypothetical protein